MNESSASNIKNFGDTHKDVWEYDAPMTTCREKWWQCHGGNCDCCFTHDCSPELFFPTAWGGRHYSHLPRKTADSETSLSCPRSLGWKDRDIGFKSSSSSSTTPVLPVSCLCKAFSGLPVSQPLTNPITVTLRSLSQLMVKSTGQAFHGIPRGIEIYWLWTETSVDAVLGLFIPCLLLFS